MALRRCPWCGMLLPADANKRRRFCSAGHRCAFHNYRRGQRHAEKRAGLTCTQCGASLAGKARLYCSPRCKASAGYQRHREIYLARARERYRRHAEAYG
jgi:endogenous inhibitor of DNA gyrase (YacG/DUF329 family)